ncbi:MAG TPA: protoheme IX farnesyltransferase [Phycisphaerales bacterium]|nr:protoheme IX farnesyltransferase [Phycisphaerales bacterium]HCD34219.1 protoheme IX farnesyltransferase [Phycisphaerales bacterium]|tara:strand:- start:59548 stop:60495 length:948 start_codon:yes stop_codon:yes gene_type:complete
MTQIPAHILSRFKDQDLPLIPSRVDLMTLLKVRITVMVMITASIGFIMASREALEISSLTGVLSLQGVVMLWMLLGVALSCMGASALNQVIERHTDAQMPRTADRPIPAGRLHPMSATVLGVFLSTLGVMVLWLQCGYLSAMLSAGTILSYCLIYTPMKRLNSMSTIVGAVPGALPPVMGAAAAAHAVTPSAMLLFAIMFMWQLPHFLAIAWLYRKDYASGGIQVLPVEDPTGKSTFRQAVLGAVVLLPIGLVPSIVGVAGDVYFVLALVLGLLYLATTIWMAIKQDRSAARWSFFSSLVYLPAVFFAMLFNQLV